MKNNFNFYSKRETKHSCFLLLNIFSFSELISEKLCNLYRCYNLTLLYFFVVVATIISGFNFSLSLFLKSLLNTSLQTTTKKWKFLNDLCLKNCISLSSKNLAITKNKTKKLITNQILDELHNNQYLININTIVLVREWRESFVFSPIKIRSHIKLVGDYYDMNSNVMYCINASKTFKSPLTKTQ